MHSVLFYRFAGGIDFILFPLAPDQARLLAGIFHYPVANIPGRSGRLTDLHSDTPPSSAAARSCIKHKLFLVQRADSSAAAQAERGWKSLVALLDCKGVTEMPLVFSAPPLPSSPPFPVAETLIYSHSPTGSKPGEVWTPSVLLLWKKIPTLEKSFSCTAFTLICELISKARATIPPSLTAGSPRERHIEYQIHPTVTRGRAPQ